MPRRFVAFTALALALVAAVAPARAIEVPDGCAVPPAEPAAQVFYIDPERGDPRGDGSRERPWRTLADVLSRDAKLLHTRVRPYVQRGDDTVVELNAGGLIKAGAELRLMTGDHGDVRIAGALNDAFIRVVAAPGQTPVVRTMRLDGAARWLFSGLTFRAEKADGDTRREMVSIGRAGGRGPSRDIVFVNNRLSTVEDASAWTPQDWTTKPFRHALQSHATCVTIAHNTFYNVRDALAVFGDDTLVEHNTFRAVGNDAIDHGASNVTIRFNDIRDGRNSKSEELHADGIQGWSIYGRTNRNVVIEGNTIVKTGDRWQSYMQGIAIFDGQWDGLVIRNNVVITNIWHGIAVYGVNNATIVNNTVIGSDPTRATTWIMVNSAKNGRPSENVLVRNNIAPVFNVLGGETVVVDHNIAERSFQRNGEKRTQTGVDGDRNWVVPRIFDTLVEVDHANERYDLRPRPNSPAAGAGRLEAGLEQTSRSASAVDIGARPSAPQ